MAGSLLEPSTEEWWEEFDAYAKAQGNLTSLDYVRAYYAQKIGLSPSAAMIRPEEISC